MDVSTTDLPSSSTKHSHTASSTVLLVVVSYCLVKRNIINLMHAPGEDLLP
jgi:hypothetical protein